MHVLYIAEAICCECLCLGMAIAFARLLLNCKTGGMHLWSRRIGLLGSILMALFFVDSQYAFNIYPVVLVFLWPNLASGVYLLGAMLLVFFTVETLWKIASRSLPTWVRRAMVAICGITFVLATAASVTVGVTKRKWAHGVFLMWMSVLCVLFLFTWIWCLTKLHSHLAAHESRAAPGTRTPVLNRIASFKRFSMVMWVVLGFVVVLMALFGIVNLSAVVEAPDPDSFSFSFNLFGYIEIFIGAAALVFTYHAQPDSRRASVIHSDKPYIVSQKQPSPQPLTPTGGRPNLAWTQGSPSDRRRPRIAGIGGSGNSRRTTATAFAAVRLGPVPSPKLGPVPSPKLGPGPVPAPVHATPSASPAGNGPRVYLQNSPTVNRFAMRIQTQGQVQDNGSRLLSTPPNPALPRTSRWSLGS